MMTETFLRVHAAPHHHDCRERLGVIIDLESTVRPCCGNKKKLLHVAIARRPEAFAGSYKAESTKELRRLIRRNLRKSEQISRKLRVMSRRMEEM